MISNLSLPLLQHVFAIRMADSSCDSYALHDRLMEMPLRVDIQCVECILDGSPAVSELRLQDRVKFDVHTCFKCQQGTGACYVSAVLQCMTFRSGLHVGKALTVFCLCRFSCYFVRV